MIFTTSDPSNRQLFGLWVLCLLSLFLWACTEVKHVDGNALADKMAKDGARAANAVPTLPSDLNARITVPTILPPVEHNPELPAPPTKERPFYGSTMFMGEVTSVYYYPEGGSSDGTPDAAATHIKFDHREDDIWLCGDLRPKFTPGEKYRMIVTFEANTECQTNWKFR